jgi:hypothetical protein
VAWERALADDVWNKLRERITVDTIVPLPIEPEAAPSDTPSEPQ